jgi:GH15 family glucan-1,4-alpha-glucosidase
MSKPLSYDNWLLVRDLVDYACTLVDKPDLSIWEVRGQKQHFVYSKVRSSSPYSSLLPLLPPTNSPPPSQIMLWVAIDRGIRLAEKRSLPAPNREKWYAKRDWLYDEIMEKGYNKELGQFGQSYEHNDVLDAATLIAPLCFFTTASDPRFQSTLKAIMKARDRGGLCAYASLPSLMSGY